MEKQQNKWGYKLFACLIAAVLVIGLSALPALAEPSAETSGTSISITATDVSNEKTEKTESASDKAADKKDTSAESDPASSKSEENKGVASAQKPASNAGSDQKAETKTEEEVVVTPADVAQAELGMAVTNSTGIQTASTENESAAVNKARSLMSAQAADDTYGFTIRKLISGKLFTTLDENNQPDPAEYIVEFRIKGYDAEGKEIFSKMVPLKLGKNNQKAEWGPFSCEPGRYVVEEVMYDGCGYEVIGKSTQEIVIGSHEGQQAHPIFEFQNIGTGERIPNKGYINNYTFNSEDANGAWSYTSK